MRTKILWMTLGSLACLFLAAVPAAADDGSGNGSPGVLAGLVQQVLEWAGAIAEPANDLLSGPPATALSGSGGGEPGNPEVGPFIPPVG